MRPLLIFPALETVLLPFAAFLRAATMDRFLAALERLIERAVLKLPSDFLEDRLVFFRFLLLCFWLR